MLSLVTACSHRFVDKTSQEDEFQMQQLKHGDPWPYGPILLMKQSAQTLPSAVMLM